MNNGRPTTWTERFVTLAQSAGAALTVTLALVFTLVIAVFGLFLAPDEGKVAVATAGFTALGTIAGAYFGVRVGAHGKEQADRALEETQLVVEGLAERATDREVQQARKDAADTLKARQAR